MTNRHRARWLALSLPLLALAALSWWYGVVQPAREQSEQESRKAIAWGRSELQRGRPDLALRAISRVPLKRPWDVDVLAIKGLALAAMNRPEQARPYLERSLALDRRQPMVAKVLAAVYFTANEPDRGFHLLETAARLDQRDFRPWFAAGDIILRFRYPPDKAVTAFREALRRRPDHEESRIGLVDALLATGETDEATGLLEEIRRDHPADPRVLCLAARHARLLGHTDDMGRYAAEALEQDPGRQEALVLRAQALHLTGQHAEALPLAERAVSQAPDDLQALHILATIEGALGLKERAAATSKRHRQARERSEQIQRLSSEIQKRPKDPEPRLRLGRLAAEAGMTSLAIHSFEAALALDPSSQAARAGLLALRNERGTTGDARP
jgi:tetratricopeptide (TPR) repeat protein